jgi:dienelactone hydrolase
MTRRRFLLDRVVARLVAPVVLVLAAALAGSAAARSLGVSGEVTAMLGDTPITVYTYRPQGCARPAFLFVFHGNGRTAESYRDSARPLADEVCLLVFSPLFDEERFPNWSYHRGGVMHDGEPLPRDDWTVDHVAELVEWARRTEGRADARYYLFGHSAGGQFLSRVGAYAPPEDAERVVIANPSTQVLPSLDEDAPYGMGELFDRAEGEAQIRAYLALPITIYLGLDDTGDEDLTMTEAAVRQGDNRLERGKFVFQTAEAVARAHGWEFAWELVLVPGLGHSARDALAADEIMEALDLPVVEMAPE